MSARVRISTIVLVASTLAGCPKSALPPPPRGSGGPVQVQLARRDLALSAVRASVIVRWNIPSGGDARPRGKVHAVVLSAARPDRARLEMLTPLGTPGATMLLSGDQLQVYNAISNELFKAPIDAPGLAEHLPIPVPLKSLSSLLRGTVPLMPGEASETKVLATGTSGAATAVEVRAKGQVVQRVTVSDEGGYPTEDVHFEGGAPVLTVRYSNYGGVETASGPVAFPQKMTATLVRPEGIATLEVLLSDVEIAPRLGTDAFTLSFDPSRPPRLQELP